MPIPSRVQLQSCLHLLQLMCALRDSSSLEALNTYLTWCTGRLIVIQILIIAASISDVDIRALYSATNKRLPLLSLNINFGAKKAPMHYVIPAFVAAISKFGLLGQLWFSTLLNLTSLYTKISTIIRSKEVCTYMIYVVAIYSSGPGRIVILPAQKLRKQRKNSTQLKLLEPGTFGSLVDRFYH